MVRQIDGSNMQKLFSDQRQENNAAPIGFTSVTQGALRILSAGGLFVGGLASAIVEGLLRVTGTLEVIGLLNISGTTTQTGPYRSTGDETHSGNETHTGVTTNNGPTTNNGDVTNVGKTTQQGDYEGTGRFKQTGNETHTGDITNEGTTTQKGDLKIAAPGTLRIGDGVELVPLALGGGSINFLPGGSVFAFGPNLGMVAPDATVTLSMGNGRAVVNGELKVSDALDLPGTTLAPAGVTITPLYLGSDGRVYR